MSKRILCIEDDPEMRTSVRLTLEIEGYEIEEAGDGKEGLDLALENLPDLIICDINMPGMNGFETLEELRKHKSAANIPFIFMTGEDPRTHLRKGMNLGANDFILKPFNIDDLIKAIDLRLREVEQKKEESRRAIEELSESITRALPHELRTPMTGILGMAELLKMQAGEITPDEIEELAQLLFDSAKRMNQTLEKFWIYTQCLLLSTNQTKVAASRQTGSKNIDQIIRQTAEETALSYGRSADLVLNLSSLSVAISDRYLEQAISQVIDNAFKFSIGGTKVTISSSIENNTGVILIMDQGRGMSADQIQKIHAFIQFDRERHEQQGLGLGLMIVKRLTEIHDGHLHVNSDRGKGTAVSLSFPLFREK